MGNLELAWWLSLLRSGVLRWRRPARPILGPPAVATVPVASREPSRCGSRPSGLGPACGRDDRGEPATLQPAAQRQPWAFDRIERYDRVLEHAEQFRRQLIERGRR